MKPVHRTDTQIKAELRELLPPLTEPKRIRGRAAEPYGAALADLAFDILGIEGATARRRIRTVLVAMRTSGEVVMVRGEKKGEKFTWALNHA